MNRPSEKSMSRGVDLIGAFEAFIDAKLALSLSKAKDPKEARQFLLDVVEARRDLIHELGDLM